MSMYEFDGTLVYFIRLCRFLNLQITVSSLAKAAIFTTNIDAENQTLINHKTVFGTRKPIFWIGAVMG